MTRPDVFTLAEAAKLLGVDRSCARQLVIEGKLEHLRSGRHYVVTRASLCDRLVASAKTTPYGNTP